LLNREALVGALYEGAITNQMYEQEQVFRHNK